MKDMDILSLVAYILVLVAGINSGLYGITHINFLEAILGPWIGRLFFVVIGASAGYLCYQIYLTKFKKA